MIVTRRKRRKKKEKNIDRHWKKKKRKREKLKRIPTVLSLRTASKVLNVYIYI